MQIPTEAHQLISSLGQSLGESGLQMDDEGLAFLPLSNDFFLHLQADPERQCFIGFAVVGGLPHHPSPMLLRRLLQANRFWRETAGATLSLDEEQPPRLVLADRYDWPGMEADDFVGRINQFIDVLHEVRAWLELPDDEAAPALHSPVLGQTLA